MPKASRLKETVKKKTGGWGHMDMPFFMLVVLLVVIGLIMLLSASYPTAIYDIKKITGGDAFYYFKRQVIFAGGGILVMIIIGTRLNYQALKDMTWWVLALAFVLMALVRVPGIGHYANGAYRWLNYPVQWQPSELGKFALILFFASRLSRRDERRPIEFSRRTVFGRFLDLLERLGFFELIPFVLVLAIMVGLLAIEPHMSATIQMLVIAASILFAAGIKLGWFVFGGAVAGAGLTYIMLATDYMTSRLNMWRDPWSDPMDKGLQAIQSLMAIGSGGLTGLGLGQSRQKFLYLPEPQNDFVFSIVCEELGFIGAVLVLLVFALLILRGYWLALHARDRFGSLIIVGITTLFAFQVFANVAVVTNLFPVTGISLPFFSYGGTALLIQLAEMGLVLAISRLNPVT